VAARDRVPSSRPSQGGLTVGQQTLNLLSVGSNPAPGSNGMKAQGGPPRSGRGEGGFDPRHPDHGRLVFWDDATMTRWFRWVRFPRRPPACGEMAATPDLGSGAPSERVGSNPSMPTGVEPHMPYRKIVKCVKSKERDSLSITHKTLNWRRGIDIFTLTLECGHKKVYRGSAPDQRALCKKCEQEGR
jgi:hypothetical protein